jgi:predicted esterase
MPAKAGIFNNMINSITWHSKSENPSKIMFMLPGRGIPGAMMRYLASKIDVKDMGFVIIEPVYLSWYFPPNGIHDQVKSILDIRENKKILADTIKDCLDQLAVPIEDSYICGYSAGGVMALEAHQELDQKFAAVIVLSGALIDEESLVSAKNDNPIIIKHSKDDDCFFWDERYIPMKNKLEEKNYNVKCHEYFSLGHNLSEFDAHLITSILKDFDGSR